MEKYFKEDNIYVDIDGENFEEVLLNVSKKLESKGAVNKEFYNKVLEREYVFPTGLEFPDYNIAIPHTDAEYVNDNSIVVIKPKKSVLFKDMGTNSKYLDVSVILLLLISKNEEQVAVLSGIIKKFADSKVYESVLKNNNIKEIYKIITQ